jgi:hypothetical protein
MDNVLIRFEIYVDDKLRFIKNNVRDKKNITKLLDKKGIEYKVKEHKFY